MDDDEKADDFDHTGLGKACIHDLIITAKTLLEHPLNSISSLQSHHRAHTSQIQPNYLEMYNNQDGPQCSL